MIILTLRTDNPMAEVGIYDGHTKLAYKTWEAHRQLSSTLHKTIEGELASIDKTIHDVSAIICFQGPGSFTGLRIGMAVANALSYALGIPIVATKDAAWIDDGVDRLQAGGQDAVALPFYGRDAHITIPRK